MKLSIESRHLVVLMMVAKLAAKDTRLALRGVYFDTTDPTNPRAVATNGRILLVAPFAIEDDSEPYEGQIQILPAAIGAAREGQAAIDLTAGIIVNGTKRTVCELNPDEATYPDYSVIMQTYNNPGIQSPCFGLDPLLLATVAKPLKTGCDLHVAETRSDGKPGKYRVEWDGEPDLQCMLAAYIPGRTK